MATKKETLEAALRGEGPLGKAADEEHVFVLRDQDRLFGQIVGIWASLAELIGSPAAKVDEAREIVRAATARRRLVGGAKVPD